MDVLDKFFRKYSYKFSKGYPDMNNEQDILLLENILSKLDIKVILENQELISLIKSNITDYGDIETSGRDVIKLIFSDIPNRGAQSDSMRQEVYDEI